MKTSNSLKTVIAALTTGLACQATLAQNPTQPAHAAGMAASSAGQGVMHSDRQRMSSWRSEKDALEQALKTGLGRDQYRKILAERGYTTTAINKDMDDYVEYEVVKADQTFEVQIDLDKKTGMGSKVGVDRNLWRADATKLAMRSGKAVMATKVLRNGDASSDRSNGKRWTDQQAQLEKGLPVGRDLAFYNGELRKMGYVLTSTNDREKNHVEYEVVKGRDSYELQFDLDDAGKARKIEVTTNIWQSEATEKALDRKQ